LFWDLRNLKDIPTTFTDCHSDDITQVVFHPSNDTQLLSGSTDGLVCCYDLTDEGEDASLQHIMKADSIDQLGFFGPDNHYFYAITHIDTFHLYDVNSGDVIREYGDVRNLQKQSSPLAIDSLIQCHYDTEDQRLYLFTSSFGGSVQMLHVGLHQLENVARFQGQHTEMVRACYWDKNNAVIMTGCEAGKLVQWRI
jgi:WD40 repeat protein